MGVSAIEFIITFTENMAKMWGNFLAPINGTDVNILTILLVNLFEVGFMWKLIRAIFL